MKTPRHHTEHATQTPHREHRLALRNSGSCSLVCLTVWLIACGATRSVLTDAIHGTANDRRVPLHGGQEAVDPVQNVPATTFARENGDALVGFVSESDHWTLLWSRSQAPTGVVITAQEIAVSALGSERAVGSLPVEQGLLDVTSSDAHGGYWMVITVPVPTPGIWTSRSEVRLHHQGSTDPDVPLGSVPATDVGTVLEWSWFPQAQLSAILGWSVRSFRAAGPREMATHEQQLRDGQPVTQSLHPTGSWFGFTLSPGDTDPVQIDKMSSLTPSLTPSLAVSAGPLGSAALWWSSNGDMHAMFFDLQGVRTALLDGIGHNPMLESTSTTVLRDTHDTIWIMGTAVGVGSFDVLSLDHDGQLTTRRSIPIHSGSHMGRGRFLSCGDSLFSVMPVIEGDRAHLVRADLSPANDPIPLQILWSHAMEEGLTLETMSRTLRVECQRENAAAVVSWTHEATQSVGFAQWDGLLRTVESQNRPPI